MSDADPELGPLLRRALLDRRAPEDARMRLMAARPRRRAWVAATAAAGLLIAALGVALLLRAPRQPRVAAEPKPEELVRFSEKHRPRSAQGVSVPRGEAQTAVEKNLGQDASTPSAERAGFEIVDVEAVEEGQVVQIVYRRADTTLSAFVMKPERFRRAGPFQTRDGVDFRSFSCGGRSTVIVKAGAVCRVWVADIPEARLVETVLEIEKQRASLQKVRLHLEGAG